MCKLAVGKSFCYPADKYRYRPIDCPEGFDSIYLYNEEETPQVFLHQYSIFKNYQVYPCYLIDFSILSSKEQITSKQNPPCENCTKIPPNQSKVYCITEEAYFCYDCDQEHHSSSIVAKRHNKV